MRRSWLSFLFLAALAAPVAAATVAEAEALLKARDPRAAGVVATLLAAKPNDVQARVLHTRLLLQQRKSKDALGFAEDTVDLAPGSALAHYWLGNAYGSRIGQVGMLSQASMAPKIRASFQRALELDPDLHAARAALVEYYLQAPGIVGGSVDEARKQAAELMRRDPPRGHYARARVLGEEGKDEEARQAYLAAHAARPDQPEYRMAAGLAHQQAGDKPGARSAFQQALKSDPKFAEPRAELAKL